MDVDFLPLVFHFPCLILYIKDNLILPILLRRFPSAISSLTVFLVCGDFFQDSLHSDFLPHSTTVSECPATLYCRPINPQLGDVWCFVYDFCVRQLTPKIIVVLIFL